MPTIRSNFIINSDNINYIFRFTLSLQILVIIFLKILFILVLIICYLTGIVHQLKA